MADQKVNTIKIELKTIVDLDKYGKPLKNEKGALLYSRHDANALFSLLQVENLTNSSIEEQKTHLILKHKIAEVWRKDKKELLLLADEATHLKNFLKDLPKTIRRGVQITSYLTETIVNMVSQLES